MMEIPEIPEIKDNKPNSDLKASLPPQVIEKNELLKAVPPVAEAKKKRYQ
jgi:hypothetical protein